ncbi:dipicolinic acid synthetase subunit A [Rubeoparvulum massiliense]|uniref:dipicolinic acid synthetase subunit A n=1 Tax=Rubeoparvulum massiliense TaxID=1631346 RepID=UPI00065E0ED5|nr:dipicolinic acid synthetase subunit A [Rubeoparvulum massiliense]
MLTGLDILFLGGDARQLEVIKELSQMNATISLVGFDRLESQFSNAVKRELSMELLEKADAIILPVVGLDEAGEAMSLFSEKTIQMTETHFQACSPHCTFYTGIAKEYLQQMAKRYQLRLVQLLERDDIAIYNSIPTAEGAVMMAIQHTDITIHGSKIAVLGFGRVGQTLAHTLDLLGADVRVGVRSERDYARIQQLGMEPFFLHQLVTQAHDLDMLMNTIPHLVVDALILAQLPHHTFILDLATKPGGVDFEYAKKRGLNAMLAPSLPGIVAPKTAGKILAKTLVQLLMEQQEGRS